MLIVSLYLYLSPPPPHFSFILFGKVLYFFKIYAEQDHNPYYRAL